MEQGKRVLWAATSTVLWLAFGLAVIIAAVGYSFDKEEPVPLD